MAELRTAPRDGAPERTARIRKLREEGRTMAQIAVELDLTRERVRQICHRYGISAVTPRVYKALTCVQCGEPYDPPRDRLPAVHGSSSDHLARTGHHPRTRPMPAWEPPPRLLAMMELHKEKKTSKEIAEEVGVPLSYVSWQLRRVGMAGSYNVKRDTAIIADWQHGDTYAVLHEKYHLHRSRLRQIISGFIRSGELPYPMREEKDGPTTPGAG
jgi:hypothetical protein